MALTLAHNQCSRAFTSGSASRAAPVSRRAVIVRAEGIVNPNIKKEEAKVVDMLKADDLPKKAVLCRCWRSSTFPMCNGAHVQHNKDTGDNVGPLIIEKSAAPAS